MVSLRTWKLLKDITTNNLEMTFKIGVLLDLYTMNRRKPQSINTLYNNWTKE